MPPTAPHRLRFAAIVLGCGVLTCSGCDSGPRRSSNDVFKNVGAATAPAAGAKPLQISAAQLQGSLMAYADRFIARLEQVTDLIESRSSDPVIRKAAQAAKYYPSLAVVTTAADADAETALLDLMTMIALERAVSADGWAEERFGSLSVELMKAHEELEADAWAMGAKVLTEEQLATLRTLIDGWRAEHPDQKYVSTVRFDDFTLLRDVDARRRTTLIKLNFVIDTEPATAEIRRTRLLAERALFLAGRMPLLIAWQAELLAYDLALAPEVRQSLDNAASVSDSISRLSEDVRALPDRFDAQMKSTIAMVDEREQALNGMVTNMREGLTQADAVTAKVDAVALNLKAVASETTNAANALNEVVKSTDALAGRFAKPAGAASQPDGRPFDVREYTQALTELTAAAKELNKLVQQSDAMLQSPAWHARVKEIDEAAGRRIDQMDDLSRRWLGELDGRAKQFADRMTARGAVLMGIGCAAAVIAALLFRALTRTK